ncbi:MAG: ATP-binding protein [Acidobacteria bacterium]|nr:ATP-binding protein [Acidobacteriota bacterium]
MIAVDEDRAATRGFDLLSERVLTVAGIYGPNASGKSNVIDSLAWLSMAVGTSLRAWDDEIPRDAHRFGKGPALPSEFDLELVFGGVRYAYRLEVDDSAVVFESLDSYPSRRRRNLFIRHGAEIDFRRGFSEAQGVRELLTPTTLALSAAMKVGNADCRGVGRAIAGIGMAGLARSRLHAGFIDPTIRLSRAGSGTTEPELFGDSRTALNLLRFADPGIDTFSLRDDESPYGEGLQRRRLRLVHRGNDEPVAFDFDDESAGTRKWFRLLGPALAALRNGRPLLVDEIDASLHPRLSARLLESFQDPETNRHGAQLLFTSHDVTLLNSLNRDEVWLTQKGTEGTTTLAALADFGGDRVRKSLNLERAYLQGRFGAIPEVDQVEVRRALGLRAAPRDGQE